MCPKGVGIEGRYGLGLSNISDDETVTESINNAAFQLMLGYGF